MVTLEIKVGDQVKDCDRRSANVVKDVVAVTDEYVTVKKDNRETRVKRESVHTDANKRKGYFLMPRRGAEVEEQLAPTNAGEG